MARASLAIRSGFLSALLAVALSAICFWVSAAVFGALGLDPTPPAWFSALLAKLEESSSPQEIAGMLVRAAISAVVFAPAVEEILFRGLLQTWLERALKRRRAAWILTAVAFASAHASWFFLLPLFAVSLCFSRAMDRGGLAAAILAHAIYNTVALASVVFA